MKRNHKSRAIGYKLIMWFIWMPILKRHNTLLLLSHWVISDSFATQRSFAWQDPSVHGISQAIILEWVAVCFSRCLPSPGIKPTSPALTGGFFTAELPGKPHTTLPGLKILTWLAQFWKHIQIIKVNHPLSVLVNK